MSNSRATVAILAASIGILTIGVVMRGSHAWIKGRKLIDGPGLRYEMLKLAKLVRSDRGGVRKGEREREGGRGRGGERERER